MERKRIGYGLVLSSRHLARNPGSFSRSIVSRFFKREDLLGEDPDEEIEETDWGLIPGDAFADFDIVL